MQRPSVYLIIILLATVLASCSQGEKRFKVGVSQCSEDIWREKQNSELRMGAYLHGNVELRFAAAYDSDERQVQQIDSLVGTGIDLLIVAPNQVATISPAIDRAYDKGIPVIVFERKTNSKKYTAYMGADNYEMGRVMGEYVAQQLKGRGRVVEVMGLKGSSPAIERHKGFADAIAKHPKIEIVATLQGDWTEASGHEAVNDWVAGEGKKELDRGAIDCVFGQNDRMAIGARKALAALHQLTPDTRFCGIDGLPGQGGGIQQVRDSILDATYIYPTHGDQLLQLAVDILEGNPYKQETSLMSALVTRDNARVLLMQEEEVARQSDYLDQLHQRADTYLQQLDTQRTINVMALLVIVLLLLVIVLLYLYHRGKITLRRQRVVSTLWNMEEEPAPARSEGRVEDSAVETPSAECPQPSPPQAEPENGLLGGGPFIARFREVVEAHLADSELSVEDLAAEMTLSRVQLYRKVKQLAGVSPVELLRTARLNRGYQMLLTTDKTISEVAYAVGFSAPSYFSKCFKQEFGMAPGDVRK